MKHERILTLGVLIIGNFRPLWRSRLELYFAPFRHLLSRAHLGFLKDGPRLQQDLSVFRGQPKSNPRPLTRIAPRSKTDSITSLFHFITFCLSDVFILLSLGYFPWSQKITSCSDLGDPVLVPWANFWQFSNFFVSWADWSPKWRKGPNMGDGGRLSHLQSWFRATAQATFIIYWLVFKPLLFLADI